VACPFLWLTSTVGLAITVLCTYESNLLLGLTKAPGLHSHVLGPGAPVVALSYISCNDNGTGRAALPGAPASASVVVAAYVQVPYLACYNPPQLLKKLLAEVVQDLLVEVGAVHRHRHMVLHPLTPSVLYGIFHP
jgi:hypothetical protein